MMNKRQYGTQLETLACERYTDQGYTLIEKNYTIRGGEIDAILENHEKRIYLEVKGVDYIDDIAHYITARKLNHIKRTIAYHLLANPTEKVYQLDVVFVKHNRIMQVYENVSITL